MSDPVECLVARLTPLNLHVEEGLEELGLGLSLLGPAAGRRRHRTFLVAGVVAALLGAGGIAVATGGAHTGLFGSPGFTENDTSEYLDMKAPDFRDVALGYAEGVDFAPGYSADMYIGILNPARREAQMPPELANRGELMQATGVKGDIENWAFCSWAHVSISDPNSLSHMRAIAHTAAMAATNQKDYNLALVDKAASGDTAPLAQYVHMNCPTPTLWPQS